MIPFNRPALVGREWLYLQEAVEGGQISGDGSFTRRCQDLLQSELGAPKALLTTSCTHALELAALLLKLEVGDEVIVPDFTFVSTANAFALHGARPVFVDVDPRTLNMNPADVERRLSSHTRAIVPVHYAGIGCEMEALCEIARRAGVHLIEDNAHGLFGKYRGQALGTFGALATLSFHETKNFSCGEGGALLLNDTSFIDRAEILREKGTNRKRFFRGEVDKYTWVDIGSSYLPSDLLAAFLLAQLEQKEVVLARRRGIFERYQAGLAAWAEEHGIGVPLVPEDRVPSYHMFFLVMPTPELRGILIDRLRSSGIQAVFHYQPLHLSEMGRRWGGEPGDCPISESVSERLVRLPFYTGLSDTDQGRVIDALLSTPF